MENISIEQDALDEKLFTLPSSSVTVNWIKYLPGCSNLYSVLGEVVLISSIMV